MGIRQALRRCQQDARRPSRRSSPRFPSLLLQCSEWQDSWMGLVNPAPFGVWVQSCEVCVFITAVPMRGLLWEMTLHFFFASEVRGAHWLVIRFCLRLGPVTSTCGRQWGFCCAALPVRSWWCTPRYAVCMFCICAGVFARARAVCDGVFLLSLPLSPLPPTPSPLPGRVPRLPSAPKHVNTKP